MHSRSTAGCGTAAGGRCRGDVCYLRECGVALSARAARGRTHVREARAVQMLRHHMEMHAMEEMMLRQSSIQAAGPASLLRREATAASFDTPSNVDGAELAATQEAASMHQPEGAPDALPGADALPAAVAAEAPIDRADAELSQPEEPAGMEPHAPVPEEQDGGHPQTAGDAADAHGPRQFIPDIVEASQLLPPPDADVVQRGEARLRHVISCLSLETNATCAPSASLSESRTQFFAQDSGWTEWLTHYRLVQRSVASFHDVAQHGYVDYMGPWLENVWINIMRDARDAYDWFPLVPLLLPITDIEQESPERLAEVEQLLSMLREDMAYMLVTQMDTGVPSAQTRPTSSLLSCSTWRNVFIVSAGGWGSMPVPLIKGSLGHDRKDDLRFKLLLGMIGKVHFGRQRIEEALDRLGAFSAENADTVHLGTHEAWTAWMLDTALNVAPFGYGRTSFRVAEAVQLEVPVLYVYADQEWLPYASAAVCDGPEDERGVGLMCGAGAGGATTAGIWGLHGIGFSVSQERFAEFFSEGLCGLFIPVHSSDDVAWDLLGAVYQRWSGGALAAAASFERVRSAWYDWLRQHGCDDPSATLAVHVAPADVLASRVIPPTSILGRMHARLRGCAVFDRPLPADFTVPAHCVSFVAPSPSGDPLSVSAATEAAAAARIRASELRDMWTYEGVVHRLDEWIRAPFDAVVQDSTMLACVARPPTRVHA